MNNIRSEVKQEIQNLRNAIYEVTLEIEVARRDGDPENIGICHELQDKLRFLNRRVKRLVKSISQYTEDRSTSALNLGNTVKIQFENSLQKTITLVLPTNANPKKGFISSKSPLGEAIQGKSKGEIVTFQTPHGNQSFSILDIA